MCFCSTKTLVTPRQGLFITDEKFDKCRGLIILATWLKVIGQDKLGEGLKVRFSEIEKWILMKWGKQHGFLMLSLFCLTKIFKHLVLDMIEETPNFQK
jgi:hypothetical protein